MRWPDLFSALCACFSLHGHEVTKCASGVCSFIFLVQRHLLWMLPIEAWQEVLGFCPFDEYARMTTSMLASREFYFLLKQSLLELRFGSMLPSPALGGLWMASRDMLATYPRVLLLGLVSHSFQLLLTCGRSFVLSSFLLALRRERVHAIISGGEAPGGDRATALVAEAGGQAFRHGPVPAGGAPPSRTFCSCTLAAAGGGMAGMKESRKRDRDAVFFFANQPLACDPLALHLIEFLKICVSCGQLPLSCLL